MKTNKKPLVSIISPCYNGEQFIERYLEAILSQTYGNIELIFVNDGSTDNTEKIVLSYKNKFISRKINLIYIYQENKGQAAAINQGLRIFKGKYLTWPDTDDVLHKDYVKSMVEFMEHNPEYGITASNIRIMNENYTQQIWMFKRNQEKDNKKLFLDFIKTNNVYFPGYFASRDAFIKTHPDMHIYESRGGQNWQMILPIVYSYRCGYIDDFLYNYVVRDNSHSRNVRTEEELIDRSNEHKDILVNVIKEMNIPEEESYLDIIEKKNMKEIFKIACDFSDKSLIMQIYNRLININDTDIFYDMVIDQGIEVQKYKHYYNLLNKWIVLVHKGLSIEKYFLKYKLNNIAIYGMGEIGTRLYEELIHTNISIKYAIDSNVTRYSDIIKVVSLDDVLEPVDAIVVTTLSFFNEVYKKIKKKVDYRIISLDSIISEVLLENQ